MAVIRPGVCSLLVLLSALASELSVATAQEKIKLGLLPFSELLAAVIADKQGFFKEEGLTSRFEVRERRTRGAGAAVRPPRHRPEQHGLDVSGHRARSRCHRACPGSDRADVAARYDDRLDGTQGLDQVAEGSRRQTRGGQRHQQHGLAACGGAARQAWCRSQQGPLHGSAVSADERSAAERAARRDRSGRAVPLGADGDR